MSTIFLLILVVIGFAYLINKLNSLESKLKKFEENNFTPNTTTNTQPVISQPIINDNYIHIDTPAQTQQNPQPITTDHTVDNLINWLKQDLLLKVGGGLILLGFAWLVSYAFLNNWIGPVGRITLGLVTGTLLMAGGNKRIVNFKNQGLTIIAVGASISLITIFSAQSFYYMFPPIIALMLCALVTIFCSASSIIHNDKPLIIVAFITGALAPILTSSPDPSITGLFGYLLALNIGILWITYYKDWRFLVILSIILTSLYSVPYFVGNNYNNLLPSQVIQLKFFAITFATFYFASEVLLIIKTKKVEQSNLISSFLIGMFTLGWIFGLMPEHLRGLTTLSASLVYMLASFYIFKITKIPNVVYTYFGTSLLLLISATSFEFSGPTLTIALTMQALIIPIVASRFINKSFGTKLLLYFVLPAILSIESIESSSWDISVFNQDLAVLLVLTSSLFIVGYNQLLLFKEQSKFREIGKILITISGVYTLIIIWLATNSVIDKENIARTVVLITYTLIGLVANIKGQINQNNYLNKFGLAVITLVIARLLFVEVWQMQLSWRIVTFIGTGLLLMGSVFIPKNIKHETPS